MEKSIQALSNSISKNAFAFPSSEADGYTQECSSNGNASVAARVMSFCQLHKLTVQFLSFPVLFRSIVSVHGGAVESPETFDQLLRLLVGRDEMERVFLQGNVFRIDSSLFKTFDSVALHTP